MITLEKENDQKYYVLWENGKQIGTFEMDVDGFFYFWDERNSYGSWSSYYLRVIADKLDEINKPFQDKVDEYFEQEKLIGQTLKSAEKELKGREYRVVREDKTDYMITDDLHLYRLNLEIDGGVITNVYNG